MKRIRGKRGSILDCGRGIWAAFGLLLFLAEAHSVSGQEGHQEVPPPPPVFLKESGALPLSISSTEEVLDGYRVSHTVIHSPQFALTAPNSQDSYWDWKMEDRNTVALRHRVISDLKVEVEVYPAKIIFAESPLNAWQLGGYLEGLRREWEKKKGRTFSSLENTAEQGGLIKQTGPMIYDQNGNPRGHSGRPRREKILGRPFERISYLLSEEGEEGAEVAVYHTEWWIDMLEWRGRVHFSTMDVEKAPAIRDVIQLFFEPVTFAPQVDSGDSEQENS